MDTERIIKLMVDRIASEFHPEKIILFGSMATGTATEDSDVDLLVIVKEAPSQGELCVAMRRAVGVVGLAKDIFVLTADEFDRKRNIPATFAYPAAHEGKVLYAA